MTVTYTKEIATASFGCFLKLLIRWRGSIYQLLWKEFVIFVALYYMLALIYWFALNEKQKKDFEIISRYCEVNNTLIPVAFVLGFFVSLVMTRWWNILGRIPWPDRMAMFVTANVHGQDEEVRAVRRTLLRYFNLSYAITMSRICTPVRKRFPTLRHLVEAGLLTDKERALLMEMSGQKEETPNKKTKEKTTESKFIEPNLFCVPLAWSANLVSRARQENIILDDMALKTLVDEINEFRGNLATLFVYDMITLPLVYLQVVTIAVYMFFLACLMGRQFIENDVNKENSLTDVYFPLFTFLEFFFYMGWLKVAECLANPFGEDDDDFDMNFLIDRNIQVSYMLVDTAYKQNPELSKDLFWDRNLGDVEMPYTAASQRFRLKKSHMMGSAMDLSISQKDLAIIPPPMDFSTSVPSSSFMSKINEEDEETETRVGIMSTINETREDEEEGDGIDERFHRPSVTSQPGAAFSFPRKILGRTTSTESGNSIFQPRSSYTPTSKIRFGGRENRPSGGNRSPSSPTSPDCEIQFNMDDDDMKESNREVSPLIKAKLSQHGRQGRERQGVPPLRLTGSSRPSQTDFKTSPLAKENGDKTRNPTDIVDNQPKPDTDSARKDTESSTPRNESSLSQSSECQEMPSTSPEEQPTQTQDLTRPSGGDDGFHRLSQLGQDTPISPFVTSPIWKVQEPTQDSPFGSMPTNNNTSDSTQTAQIKDERI